MTLASDIASALAELRAEGEAALPATCVIRRGTGHPVIGEDGEPVIDEVSAEYVMTAPQVIYTGACDLKYVSNAVIREVDAQSRPAVEQEPILKLPVAGSEGVKVNDVAEITAHRFDAALVGVTVRVAGVHGGAVTLRRLPVEVTNG